jgi:hypothetical protein
MPAADKPSARQCVHDPKAGLIKPANKGMKEKKLQVYPALQLRAGRCWQV